MKLFRGVHPAPVGGNSGTSSSNPIKPQSFGHYSDKIPGDWQKRLSFTNDMERSESKNQANRNYR